MPHVASRYYHPPTPPPRSCPCSGLCDSEKLSRSGRRMPWGPLTRSFILQLCAKDLEPSIFSQCLFFIKARGRFQSVTSASSSSPSPTRGDGSISASIGGGGGGGVRGSKRSRTSSLNSSWGPSRGARLGRRGAGVRGAGVRGAGARAGGAGGGSKEGLSLGIANSGREVGRRGRRAGGRATPGRGGRSGRSAGALGPGVTLLSADPGPQAARSRDRPRGRAPAVRGSGRPRSALRVPHSPEGLQPEAGPAHRARPQPAPQPPVPAAWPAPALGFAAPSCPGTRPETRATRAREPHGRSGLRRSGEFCPLLWSNSETPLISTSRRTPCCPGPSMHRCRRRVQCAKPLRAFSPLDPKEGRALRVPPSPPPTPLPGLPRPFPLADLGWLPGLVLQKSILPLKPCPLGDL